MDTSNRTFVSSVLFIDIVEYSRQSVTDQHALKQQFNTLLVDAMKHVALSDRIVLDTGDGAAVSFQGNPEDSLFAAMHLRDAIEAIPSGRQPELAVRFGINLGPVRLIKDINGQVNIIGDGINVAQRVMSFAEPGTILVSRSYYEVVSRLSDDYAKIFSAAGTRTDKHVREHAVYEIGHSIDGLADRHHDAVLGNAVDKPGNKTAASASARPKRTSTEKRLIIAATLAAVMVLGTILAVLLNQDNTAAESDTTKPVVAQKRKPAATAAANETAPSAALQKIAVALAIKPWGEVYVDGRKKGVSPPLKSILLTPGKHIVEIRNTSFPADVNTITVKAGDTPRIEHRF